MALGFIRRLRAAALSAGAWSAWLGLAGETCPLSGSETAGPCEDSKRAPQGDPLGGSARSGRWRKVSNRPVLKHGPRSLTCMRVGGWKTHEAQEN